VPDAVEFDHVALAMADRGPFWSMFAGDLAGRWLGGSETLGGFAFAQLRFSNGMKVEGLEPFWPEGNDFLVRFLAASGPGPHHLTFRVADIEVAIDRARSSGYRPLGINLDARHWKEAFIHPREACGIVVQLAWSDGEPDEARPAWLPSPRVDAAAELVHVAHAVSDLPAALELFKGLLDGCSTDAGAGGGLGWVDLAWPGPGRIRLLAGDPVSPWLGSRPGRLHHLAFRVENPAGVEGAVGHDGWWEVESGPRLGTRLVLVEREAPVPVVPLPGS